MKEILNQLSDSVRKRMETDEKLRKKLDRVSKTFCITFDEKESYNFSIENGTISEIMDGRKESDIMVDVDSETFRKILSKEVDPLAAYMEKKIRVKASLLDKLLITELFK